MEEAYYKLLYDILCGYDRTTPKNIVNLRNNQIFVFGTDVQGSQIHGAAGIAAKSLVLRLALLLGQRGCAMPFQPKVFRLKN